MIEIKSVTKKFGEIRALNEISLEIEEGKIFGLIGTNGAGKSTLMNILSGVYRQDSGEVLIDGETVYENEEIKAKIGYISDEPFYPRNSTPESMAKLYQSVYSRFDIYRFYDFMAKLDLDKKRKISTFSKGMKKQLSIALVLCINPKYLILDETFDGLDPSMRQVFKSLFINAMAENNVTPIIASHNLREIEDICDTVGVIHKGGVILNKDLVSLKLGICKLQFAFAKGFDVEEMLAEFKYKIYHKDVKGSLYTLIVEANEENALEYMQQFHPIFCESLSLNLEEIFITQTEVEGYDIKKIIL